MMRIILTLAVIPLILAVAVFLLCWKCLSGAVWQLDRAIDDVFERWM